jgi:hypothetical protein
MADQQDRPDETPDAAAPATESASSAPSPDQVPPAPEPPAPPAEKTPAKAAKKTPAKAAKKTPAKKAPAKKAAAKKAPPKTAPAVPNLADTNGDLTSAAKEAAAHAKSTVASAPNPVSGPAPVPLIGPEPSRLPIVAAIAAGVLAIIVVLLARRHSDD